MSRVSRTTPRFEDLLGGLTTFSILMVVIYYSERVPSKISKEKVQGVNSGGYQVQASKSLLPVVSHGMHLTLPGVHWDHTVKCCQPGKLSAQCSEFLLVAGHVGSLCLAYTRIQTPRKTAGSILFVQFRYGEPFSMGTIGTLLMFLDASQGPPKANLASRPFLG